MSTASKMLESHPQPLGEIDRVKLTAAIDACAERNQACTACADACLSEDDVDDLTSPNAYAHASIALTSAQRRAEHCRAKQVTTPSSPKRCWRRV